MGKLIYSMGVSLDGFVAGPDGEIDWTAPDQELHRFHNEQTRELGAQFCGRKLYKEMLFWDTVDQGSLGPAELEFAGIWRELPKVVFSSTLGQVEGNARLELVETRTFGSRVVYLRYRRADRGQGSR